MMKRVVCSAVVLLLSLTVCSAQTSSFQKNFNLFKDVAPGVDFYAKSRSDFAAFEKPVREARQKLEGLLNRKLSRGAIVICSTMEQKDSVQDKRVLKLGYSWVLIQLTPEAATQQMIAMIKARLGNMVPPGVLDMIQKRPPEQKAADDARIAGPMVQKMCFALLETTLLPEKEFKSSRLDDLSRSPLADWIDLGIAWYASGTGLSVRFLQEKLDEAFPLEDLLSMPRPFVAPLADAGGSGAQMVIQPGPGVPGGATPPPGGTPFGSMSTTMPPPGGGPMIMTLPKDVQDRMIFDSQSASFFSYVLTKVGREKTMTIIQENLQGKLTRDILGQTDFLGSDIERVETEWRDWVKKQKPEEPVIINRMASPAPPH